MPTNRSHAATAGEDDPIAEGTRRLWQRTVLVGALSAVAILLVYGVLQAQVVDLAVRRGVFVMASVSLAGVAGLGLLIMLTGIPAEGVSPTGVGLGERHQRVQELEERVEDLERSNTELEQFAYVASHDLQEPLRMISGFLQRLEEDHAERLDEDALEYIDHASTGAERMSELIEGLLSYARVGSRGDPMGPVELEDVLEHAMSNLALAIDDSEAIIEHGALPRVQGDLTQLTQLLQNLLENAIKFSKEGERPRVRISAESEPGAWLIRVEDKGVGFDPEEKDDMFQIFQRVSSGENLPGTGVGLAVCKRIVSRHGGEIEATGEPDEGAQFLVRLPALGPEPVEASTLKERSRELI